MIKQDLVRLLKDLEPHEANDTNENVAKKWKETLDRLFEMLRNLMAEELVPREWQATDVVSDF